MHSVSIMGYEKLRVAKPLKQLIKVLELHTRHIARENSLRAGVAKWLEPA